MNLTDYSVPQLREILERIPTEIKRREKQEKALIRKELEELAAKSGYTLEQLLGEATEKVAKVKKPVAVKYRHPEDASLTWTGRGRQPKWVDEFIAAGGDLEGLAL